MPRRAMTYSTNTTFPAAQVFARKTAALGEHSSSGLLSFDGHQHRFGSASHPVGRNESRVRAGSALVGPSSMNFASSRVAQATRPRSVVRRCVTFPSAGSRARAASTASMFRIGSPRYLHGTLRGRRSMPRNVGGGACRGSPTGPNLGGLHLPGRLHTVALERASRNWDDRHTEKRSPAPGRRISTGLSTANARSRVFFFRRVTSARNEKHNEGEEREEEKRESFQIKNVPSTDFPPSCCKLE